MLVSVLSHAHWLSVCVFEDSCCLRAFFSLFFPKRFSYKTHHDNLRTESSLWCTFCLFDMTKCSNQRGTRNSKRHCVAINGDSMSVTRVSRRRSLSVPMLLRHNPFCFFWNESPSFWVAAWILVTFQVKGQSVFSSYWSLVF